MYLVCYFNVAIPPTPRCVRTSVNPTLTSQMQFLGVHQPTQAAARSEPVLPQAIIVGQVGSPGLSLDLGRTGAALPGAMRGYVECDVLLVMTRKRAVLLYFAVGEDVR